MKLLLMPFPSTVFFPRDKRTLESPSEAATAAAFLASGLIMEPFVGSFAFANAPFTENVFVCAGQTDKLAFQL